MRLRKGLRRRPAGGPREVREERVAREKLDPGAGRVRIGGPGALDVDRRSEAADRVAARPPQHLIDEALIVLGRRPVGPPRLEQPEELRAAAEAQEGRDAVAHRRRQLPHAAEVGVAERIPVPPPGMRGVPPGLGGIVPVVRAAEDGDRRRTALREQLRVEERIVALDRLEDLARLVARGRVERLAEHPERSRVAVVAKERRQESGEARLQELRVVRVVGDLAPGRRPRLGRRVGVDAHDPWRREDRARHRPRGTPRSRGRRGRPPARAGRSSPWRPS